ncbi:hypothetical protein KBZ12_15555, partial [Cyanobium sp. Cruz CV13-4-11]
GDADTAARSLNQQHRALLLDRSAMSCQKCSPAGDVPTPEHIQVEEEDVLLNITGASVARCAMVPSHLLPARVNQHVAIVRADKTKVSPFYLLDAINSDFHKQQLLAFAQGGATREALTKDTISAFQITLPPAALMSRYGQIAGSIHLQREVLLRQVQNLRFARDILLPRLLSGQIDVEELPEP